MIVRVRPQYPLVMLLLGAPAAWAADGFEVTLLGGWTAPTAGQRVAIDTAIDLPQIPGTTLRQDGEFAIDGRGSFAFGGSLAYFFTPHVAIEARVDTVDFRVDMNGPRITGTTELPPPLPPLDTTLDISNGSVNVERLFPFSANLKLRTGGSTRFIASAGVSFLPRLGFTARQEASLEVGTPAIGTIALATVAVEADARSDLPAKDRFGFNGGLGLEVQLSDRVALIGEGRVFAFPTQELSWRPATPPGSEVEQDLLDQVLTSLGPLELPITYFHVSGGLVVRF
jgi:hypothetical protein